MCFFSTPWWTSRTLASLSTRSILQHFAHPQYSSLMLLHAVLSRFHPLPSNVDSDLHSLLTQPVNAAVPSILPSHAQTVPSLAAAVSTRVAPLFHSPLPSSQQLLQYRQVHALIVLDSSCIFFSHDVPNSRWPCAFSCSTIRQKPCRCFSSRFGASRHHLPIFTVLTSCCLL